MKFRIIFLVADTNFIKPSICGRVRYLYMDIYLSQLFCLSYICIHTGSMQVCGFLILIDQSLNHDNNHVLLCFTNN